MAPDGIDTTASALDFSPPPVADAALDAEARLTKVQKLIREHVVISMAAGLIPAPGVDLGVALVNQMTMLGRLSGLYKVRYTRDLGKSVIGSLMAGGGGTFAGAGLSLTLAKSVPVVGTALGIIAMPTVLGAYTYALGKVFQAHFDAGGTLLDFKADRYRDFWRKMVKQGKDEAEGLRDEAQAYTAAPAAVPA